MNRGEIKTRISAAINDNRISPVFVTDSQLNTLIDEAIEILAEDSHAIKRTAYLPLRPGLQFVYTPSIAPDMMFPWRIWDQGIGRRMIATTMAELDGYQTRWWNTTGTSPEFWFPISWDLFGVFPKAIAPGGTTLRVDYVAWPRGLMDDNDEPEFPQATHDAITLWAIYQSLLKKWDSATALQAFQSFQASAGMAAGRSGMGKVSTRIFQRNQRPQVDYPSSIDLRGD